MQGSRFLQPLRYDGIGRWIILTVQNILANNIAMAQGNTCTLKLAGWQCKTCTLCVFCSKPGQSLGSGHAWLAQWSVTEGVSCTLGVVCSDPGQRLGAGHAWLVQWSVTVVVHGRVTSRVEAQTKGSEEIWVLWIAHKLTRFWPRSSGGGDKAYTCVRGGEGEKWRVAVCVCVCVCSNDGPDRPTPSKPARSWFGFNPCLCVHCRFLLTPWTSFN